MNITFDSIAIDNFLSIGHIELDLRGRGFTLINGINQYDNATSNGSGKSAIWDALCWGLTGKSNREIQNHNTEGDCAVEVHFSINNDNYTIKRVKGLSLSFTVNGKDCSGKGIRDTDKVIQSTLPDIDFSVIILGQGLPLRFSNNTPAGRKEVLENLSKSDYMINDIKDRIGLRKEELTKKQRQLQDEQLSITAQQKTLADIITRNEYIYIDTTELEQSIADGENDIQSKQSEKDIKDTQLRGISDRLNSYAEQTLKIKKQADSIYGKTIDNLKESVFSIKGQAKAKQKQIDEINAIKDICPTCGQKIADKPSVKPYEEQLKEINAMLDKKQNELDEVMAQYEVAVEEGDFTDVTAKDKAEQLKLQREISTLDNDIKNLQKTLDKNKKELSNKNDIKSRNAERARQREEAQEKLDNLTEQDNKVKAELDDTTLRIEANNKLLTVATRDFRGYLLSNIINYIDQKAKDYAKEVVDKDISFKLNGNNIDIMYDNKLYESLSGGERQKVDIIIQFAIRDMLCNFSNFSCNILVLDELFDNLDQTGCERVLNLITNKLTDIESIFIITHHNDIQLPVDSTITILKNNQGISGLLQ